MTDIGEEQKQEMDRIWKEISEAENLMAKENQKILEIVKKNTSPEMFDEIEHVIEDSDHTYDFKIVDEPKGEFQQEDEYPVLGGIWVDQTTNGGYTGDDFAGTVSIKIDNRNYLEFAYSM